MKGLLSEVWCSFGSWYLMLKWVFLEGFPKIICIFIHNGFFNSFFRDFYFVCFTLFIVLSSLLFIIDGSSCWYWCKQSEGSIHSFGKYFWLNVVCFVCFEDFIYSTCDSWWRLDWIQTHKGFGGPEAVSWEYQEGNKIDMKQVYNPFNNCLIFGWKKLIFFRWGSE